MMPPLSTVTSPVTSPLRCFVNYHLLPPLRFLTLSPKCNGGGGTNNSSSLELHKPSPPPARPVADSEPEEPLSPFLKFFNPASPATAPVDKASSSSDASPPFFEYYDPKPGDFAVGLVVGGDENKLEVDIAADMPAVMLTKDVLPLYDGELDYLLQDSGKIPTEGRVGIVMDDEAAASSSRSSSDDMKGVRKPKLDVGTVIFSEVIGRSLSGRPVLSARKMYWRVAWHRVRQIKQLNEPIEVKIFEWNTGGLLTRIEGLRAFLPKAELVNRVHNYTDLKNNVGRQILVCIMKIDEAANELIVSEKEAWDMKHLKEGTLLQGTIKKILPYGAQVRIGDSNRSGLLHVSKISQARVGSVSDVLKVDEEVKVLVVKSIFPDKIALSISELESEPGLFLSDKQRVFSEAEAMAKKYRRQQLNPATDINLPDPTCTSNEPLPFDNEASSYSNWRWFEFASES